MPRRKKADVQAKMLDFIDIAQADDFSLAEDCVNLLKENNILSTIEETKRNLHTVKVDPKRYNEAYLIIESKITIDGYFDIYSENLLQKDPNQAA